MITKTCWLQWVALNVIYLYRHSQLNYTQNKYVLWLFSPILLPRNDSHSNQPALQHTSSHVDILEYTLQMELGKRPNKNHQRKCHMWFWARDGWQGQRVCVSQPCSGSNHCCRSTNWSCLFVRPHTVTWGFWQMGCGRWL